MQRLEVSGAVRPIYGSLGVKRLILKYIKMHSATNVSCVGDMRESLFRRDTRPLTLFQCSAHKVECRLGKVITNFVDTGLQAL